jgi:sugar phosphate isomerase/epimerase
MKRRHFIKTTTATLSAPLFAQIFEQDPKFSIPTNFDLKILNTNWGFRGTTMQWAEKSKSEGYDGVELWAMSDAKAKDEFQTAMSKNGLNYGFLAGGSSADFSKHFDEFAAMLETGLAMKPLYINCHSGKDYFTADQAQKFFDLTSKRAKESGIPIYHETHRGRLCFAAHITRQFLEKNPDMRLTLDISHWCNVHESLLDDQKETVALALSRTSHIHSRVGHAEGPQVSDPRAPEWETAVKKHLAWWDTVVENATKTTQKMTILTEFGPPDYLWTLPYTRQPVADQWGINVHMMHMLRKRYTK